MKHGSWHFIIWFFKLMYVFYYLSSCLLQRIDAIDSVLGKHILAKNRNTSVATCINIISFPDQKHQQNYNLTNSYILSWQTKYLDSESFSNFLMCDDSKTM